MSWVLDLNNTPRVLTSTDAPSIDLQDVVRSGDGEWHQTAKLGVLFDCVLVILFNIVGEIVDRYTVVLDVFNNQLLAFSQFKRCKGVSPANDWHDVDTWTEAAHKFNVELTKTMACVLH